MGWNKFLDKAIDFVFDKKNLAVISVFIFGLFLRLIAARNLGVTPDDVIHSYKAMNIFGSGKLVVWDQSTSLWYYIQGFFYKFFGLTVFSSRFAEVIFGSFLIVLVYVFTKKVFRSQKAALIASFLIAISPIMIRETMPEMDVAVCFFLVLGMYYLFSYFEDKSYKNLGMCAVILGIGTMIKLYMAFFAFSFLIIVLHNELRNEKEAKKILKKAVFFGIIFSVLVLPSFAHNYLLYKDKGYMDLIFTNTFELGADKAKEFYSWSAGWMPYSDYWGFFFGNQKNFAPTPIPGSLMLIGELFKSDPILFILGIAGMILAFKNNRRYFWVVIVIFVPAFIYLGAQIPMLKHFIWFFVLVAPVAGLSGQRLIERLKGARLRHLFAVMILFSLIYLTMPSGIGMGPAHFYGESPFNKMVKWKEGISNDAIIVTDSRIYRGNIHWAFAGKNYVEASNFFPLAEEANKLGEPDRMEVYYVECVVDDCGWGTVSSQPEFNKSMEEVTMWFANSSAVVKEFSGANPDKTYLPFITEEETKYRVYKTDLMINPLIHKAAKKTHSWWLIPAGYDRTISPMFDDYSLRGVASKILEDVAWAILYFEIFFSFLVLILAWYLMINKNE